MNGSFFLHVFSCGTLFALINIQRVTYELRPRGSVVGWGTMLQDRSPVRVPDEVDFLNLPNPSSRTMALGVSQPLTEMSTRNLPGGKNRPARKADNLAAIYKPNVWKCGSLNLSQPWGPPRLVTGIALSLPYIWTELQMRLKRNRVGLHVQSLLIMFDFRPKLV
jgi:hypothetical protein